MWMNQAEIESAYRNRHSCPNVQKGVRLLYLLMEATNAQSDGWHSWPVPGKAAAKLMDTLRLAGPVGWGGTRGRITDAQLKAAITPIRRMVTVQRAKQAKYGNTFDFDVDLALREPVEA